jgi:short-chain 2-methylacyl-CoA dehydrogenase
MVKTSKRIECMGCAQPPSLAKGGREGVYMNFDLTDDQEKLRATVSEFTEKEVVPVAEKLDQEGRFPTELFLKVGELGIPAIPFSQEQGGMGLGVLDMVIALEQLARGDQSLAVTTMVSVASGLTLARFGSSELVNKYLPDIVAGRKICGIAGTEPDAGSDTAGFKTRAIPKGNRWHLNGEKAYITNGGTDITSFLMILAVSSAPEQQKKSFTLFLVPNGAPGCAAGNPYRKMGWRSSDTRPFYLQDCDVGPDQIVGQLDGGRYILHRGYQQARVFLAACSLGLAQACLDHSLAYAKQRQAFGGPIGRLQLVQEMIVQMALQIDAARLLTYRAAWNVDQGKLNLKELAMSKIYACEIGTKCADLAIQVHGGWGFMDDCPVSRYYRDNRICTLGDGSTQIQTLLIARESGLDVAFS